MNLPVRTRRLASRRALALRGAGARHSDHPITRALHVRAPADGAAPAVTPLYQCSAFRAESPYFYTRKDNPNASELEEVVRVLEGAGHAISVTTGMTAIALVLDLLQAGDLLVANQDVYGCSFRLVERLAARRGFRILTLDLSDHRALARIPPDTRMVLFETPTNPFLKTIDIARVSRRVKRLRPDALVVVDNTWATPLFQHPLAHGADLSLHSATKYFSGHSDVMGGMILTDEPLLHERLREDRFYSGAILDPHSAWLLRRSMQTFALRMKAQSATTEQMRRFLAERPQVRRVYAARVDGRQLTGSGGILFFELREDLAERYADLVAALRLFDSGTGMAAVSSMVAQPYTGSHASMTAEEKASIGLTRGLVRLCFGLEEPVDLEADLLQALERIDA